MQNTVKYWKISGNAFVDHRYHPFFLKRIQLFKLFILGIINIDELSMWVLGVDRRLVVLKMMHEKRLIQASEIADSTDRSLQNISYAMREMEEQGLIKCLTPGKHTWKKYIPTEKGTKVFEKLKKNNLIN
jgi:predicted transcriptional regulator